MFQFHTNINNKFDESIKVEKKAKTNITDLVHSYISYILINNSGVFGRCKAMVVKSVPAATTVIEESGKHQGYTRRCFYVTNSQTPLICEAKPTRKSLASKNIRNIQSSLK
jgi:hypothetical protein